MMSNSIKIVLLSFLSILLIGLMFVLIFMNNFSWFPFHYESKELVNEKYETLDVKKILVDTSSSDVVFSKSSSDQIEVKIFGKDKDKFEVKLENGNLKIKKEKNFCFGYCFFNDRIEVYVPESYKSEFDVETVSGDIEFNDDFKNDLSLKTVSGDIKLKKVNDLKAKSTSGDITIEAANEAILETVSGEIEAGSLKNIKAKTTSGSVEIDDLELSKNGEISCISGDVLIRKINDVYINTKTTSGEVEIKNNNRQAEYELNISTVSGDIEVY